MNEAAPGRGVVRAGAAMADITPQPGIQLAGYVPTKRAFEGGGYETRAASWSRLAPEALETMERESLALLRGLFAMS